MANSSIDMTALDFDAAKQSLKNYLKSQDLFRDYDFEASNLSVLLDIHAYNTFKMAFLANMLLSEGFLDTAVRRNSVLSHAKELNYLPRSVRSSVARVKISFTATGESAPYIIPKGKPFTTLVKNKSFTFTNPETIICASTNTAFTFTTDIYEGRFLQDSYTYLPSTENQNFHLTNPNVDIRSLSVVVFEDGKEIGDVYRRSDTLLDVKSSSKVFFLQPTENGSYEVLFGDNNFGRQPKDGAIIVLEYRIAEGSGANGAKQFSCDFDPTSSDELLSTPTVDLLEVSRDGNSQETIDSIKYYAPRHFQVQERAVTARDFEVSLKTAFPEINAVHAFGGEELDPPQFGRVVVSIDITNVTGLPDSKKREYYEFLKRRSAFTIEPIFIEPEFTYLCLQSLVRYNVNITASSSETIKTLVLSTITDYRDENLNDFDSILRFSKLAAAIDAAEDSIVSSFTDVCCYKKTNPTLGVRQTIEMDFALPLKNDVPEKEKVHNKDDVATLWSTVFQYAGEQCIFEDDGSGNIRIMKIKGSNYEKILDIGTVDYDSGKVAITDVIIDSYYGNAIKIYVAPRDVDIQVRQNTILTIEPDEIIITIQELRL